MKSNHPKTGVNHGLCGCGGKSSIVRATDWSKGWAGGKPLRFRRGHGTLGSKPGDRGYAPNELEPGWVAGSIEGEGYFTTKETKTRCGYSCRPQPRISMTDEDAIGRLTSSIPVADVFEAGFARSVDEG